jgi:hypothetical protein
MHVAAQPSSVRAVLADFRSGVPNDICRDDLKPTAFEGATTVAILVRRLARRELRHPHGVPNTALDAS